jgi:pimeloyl-ACP methyl ester carboxylesterase
MAEMTATVREQALTLGVRNSMVGILTLARPDPGAGEEPVVVMLNAGIIHRVGANRMHVILARALAAQGVSSLRVDLSGIGDSAKRPDSLPPLDASLADVREVLDWLEARKGVTRVVLLGLCSGADHGVLYAGCDPRVVGLVLLDASIPRTPGYYLRHYASRLLRLRSWLNLSLAMPGLLARLAQPRLLEPVEQPAPDPTSLDRPEARAYLKNAYQKALDQGIDFLAVFTGDQESRHNYREQMLDALKGVSFGARLQLEYFGSSDHTFTFESERGRLVALILNWMQARAFRKGSPTPRMQQSRPGKSK